MISLVFDFDNDFDNLRYMLNNNGVLQELDLSLVKVGLLQELQIFNLQQSVVCSFPIKSLLSLQRLRTLTLQSCNMSDESVRSLMQRLVSLIYVDLSNNHLSQTTFFNHLTQLTTLNLAGNEIQQVMLTSSFIQTLNLNNNPCPKLIQLPASLKTLTIRNCQIEYISFKFHLPLLEVFDCSSNRLSYFNFVNAENLKVLDLSSNFMVTYESLKDCKKLQNCRIMQQESLQTYVYPEFFQTLHTLDISANYSLQDGGYIRRLKNLKSLFCAGSTILASDLQNLVHLQQLDFSNMVVTELSSFQHLQNLEIVDFVSCEFKTLKGFEKLSKLIKKVSLFDCGLQELPKFPPLALCQIDLSCNSLCKLQQLNPLRSVQTCFLTISRNPLTAVPGMGDSIQQYLENVKSVNDFESEKEVLHRARLRRHCAVKMVV